MLFYDHWIISEPMGFTNNSAYLHNIYYSNITMHTHTYYQPPKRSNSNSATTTCGGFARQTAQVWRAVEVGTSSFRAKQGRELGKLQSSTKIDGDDDGWWAVKGRGSNADPYYQGTVHAISYLVVTGTWLLWLFINLERINHPNWRSPSFLRGVGQLPTRLWLTIINHILTI